MERIIFDTDIGGDCDDAGALALLNALCEKGEAEMLAVTCCYSTPYLAGCVDAINRHYGRSVPVGILHDRFEPRDRTEGYNGYDRGVAERFCGKIPDWKKVPDSVRLIRSVLARDREGGITIAATGPCTTLARLAESKGDDISPLTGTELIERKVKRTVIMGGRFKGTWPCEYGPGIDSPTVDAEWNIYGDIKAAQTVCDKWPGEIIFTSHEIGNWMITLKDINDDEKRREYDPAAYAYWIHHGKGGRNSWDLTAILHAVRPNAGYWNLHPWGRVKVDDKGVTEFETAENGRHSYLMPRLDVGDVGNIIDGIIKSSSYYGSPAETLTINQMMSGQCHENI